MSETYQAKPLISVVIITYNSSAYVLDTLESIRLQTYDGPIELIVSDDASKDNTVSLCRDWMERNAARFARVELIAGQENVGISKNANRGFRCARGEWVKGLAGDDMLTDDCLETYYQIACEAGEDHQFFFSPAYSFRTGQDFSQQEGLEIFGEHIEASVIDLEYACRYALFWICSPSFFFSRSLLEDVGYYPEDVRNVEDATFIRKVLAAGYRLYQVRKPTIFYRLSEVSSTSSVVPGSAQLVGIDRYIRPALGGWRRFCLWWRLMFLRLYVATGGKRHCFIKWHFSLERRLNGEKKKKKAA